MKNYLPEIFVFFQLLFIVLLLGTAPIFNHFNFWLAFEISGILLVFWAVYEMKIGNFNIRPTVKQQGVLVTSGPYRLIRHPMYTATLLVMTGLVGEYFSFVRLAYLILLLIVLRMKIGYEEKALIKHFPAYVDYIKKSKRLLPYIY